MPKEIPLHGKSGQGKFAIVDDEDYEYLRQFTWGIETNGYVCFYKRMNGKLVRILMHRLLMNPLPCFVSDHVNRNRLDNRRENLRIATPMENTHNRSKFGESSQYKGVHWVKRGQKWQARLAVNGVRHHFGYFTSEIEAARAVDEAAKKYHGEFAYLNFP